MLSRRRLLTSALGVGLSTLPGCYRRPTGARKGASLKEAMPVREMPPPIAHVPLERKVASEEDLKQLLTCVIPDYRWLKYSLGYVYHAIRLWGRSGSFTSQPFVNPIVRELGWGAAAFSALVDDAVFRDVVSPFGKPLLVPSEFGVVVLTTKDLDWGNEWASTHPGVYEQVMAELGVPSTQKLTLAKNKEFRLRDVVSDSARRVHKEIECEWTTTGLARYLDTDCWQNRFGQWIDFDEMANWLVSYDLGEGACFGTHVPFAMATLYQLSQNGSRTLANRTRQSLRDSLQEIGRTLSNRIGPDGAWSERWWGDAGGDRRRPPGVNEEFLKILVTGHHLEWMSMCQHGDRPREHILEQAILYLLPSIQEYKETLKHDWFFYLAISHAVRAVCNLHGIGWPVAPS